MEKTVESYFSEATRIFLMGLSLVDSTKYYLACMKIFTSKMTVRQAINVYVVDTVVLYNMILAYTTWAAAKMVEDAHSKIALDVTYKPGDRIVRMEGIYKVVASIGYANDWAAYKGDYTEDTEEVASHGDKIVSFVAVDLFPEIAASGLSYRD